MADQQIDVLMMIVSKGKPMLAESRTTFEASGMDQLRQGFVADSFCELQEFSFSAGVGASLSKETEKAKKKAARKAAASDKPDRPLTAAEQQGLLFGSQMKHQAKREQSEFVDMQPVEFTRVLDTSSTLLFRALVECDTLDSISIVKRKAAGTANSGECYLRLDFEKVLVTSLDWKDSEHVIVETGTFIYRKLKIRYRPQMASGSLGTAIATEWTMKMPKK